VSEVETIKNRITSILSPTLHCLKTSTIEQSIFFPRFLKDDAYSFEFYISYTYRK